MNNIPYDIPNDVHYTIMLNANYKKTLLLLKTCHALSEIQNIWKVKIQHQYPQALYFDFWTPQENHLMLEKKYFALAINFTTEDVDNYLFEWDNMLPMVLKMQAFPEIACDF